MLAMNSNDADSQSRKLFDIPFKRRQMVILPPESLAHHLVENCPIERPRLAAVTAASQG